jgi:hypothetical protein
MNEKMVKRGIRAALIVPALVLFASCNLEVPQSIRVQASPMFRIPVPMGTGMDTNSFIRPYVSSDAIREKLAGKGGESDKIGVFEYKNENENAQTYLITYRLFDMDLDLNQYIKEVTPGVGNVPPFKIAREYADKVDFALATLGVYGELDDDGNLPYGKWINPLGSGDESLEIDLGDMKELLSDITFKQEGVTFTLETDSEAAATELARAIRIRIPQLKIGAKDDAENSWVEGTVDGKIVKFEADETIDADTPLLLLTTEGAPTSTPDEREASKKIKIELRLVYKVAAGEYKVGFDFNWNTARVYPPYDDLDFEEGAHTGKVPGFNLSSYLADLGMDDGTEGKTEVKFETVPGFLFVNIPSDGTWAGKELKIEIDGIDGYTSGKHKEDDLYDNALGSPENPKPNWLAEHEDYAITKYEFAKITDMDTIQYKLTPPESLVIQNGTDNNGKITANLAILLPMKFKFTGTAKSYNGENYLPIKFEGLDEFLEGSGDKDGVMKQLEDELKKNDAEITKLSLQLSNIKNDVIEGLKLAIGDEQNGTGEGEESWTSWHIIPLNSASTEEDIPVNTASLATLPPIKFLLEAGPVNDDSGNYTGTLTVNPVGENDASAFSLNISVVAGISLNKTIDLQ